MAHFWVVKRISFPFFVFEETHFIGIFDQKNNFNGLNKFLLDWADLAIEIPRLYIYIYIYMYVCIAEIKKSFGMFKEIC